MGKEKPFSIVLVQEFPLQNDALNKELEKFALKEMKTALGVSKEQHSNIGGWQSGRDLHLQAGTDTAYHRALQKLFNSFSEPITRFITTNCLLCNAKPKKKYDWDYTGAWFNIASKGSYNAPHTHPLNDISAAYYIWTEEPPKEYPFSGRIDFIFESKELHFFPKPGTLILFPSTMLHFVHPYYGSKNRISFSFNLNIK